MTKSESLLSAAGLRPTRQRLVILGRLARATRPLTVQSLHSDLHRKGSGIGLATIYRTVQALASAGLVRSFRASDDELAYKVCDPGHHHHLVCESCGDVAEIPSCEIEAWAREVAARRGFRATSHEAEVYGICAACAGRQSQRLRG